MSWFEKFAIKKSDLIISNLQNYGEHIKNDLNINREFEWIANGIDLDELNEIEELDNNTKNLIPKNKFIIGYTGTIGVANALDYFLECANLLKQYKDIHFIIVGNGQEEEKFKFKI